MLEKFKTPKAITAGVVFLISFVVYLSTMAQTTSFWDCGEFIACAYTLGIPHPPGSPLYLLVGRIFAMIPTEQIAAMFVSSSEANFAMPFGYEIGWRVNLMSPLLSAFSAMFTFLIIVRFLEMWQGKAQDTEKKVIHYASGVIGALAFAFSDSQWFNSVESEVYAASLFFTAIVVWLILRWADQEHRPDSDKWIVLIFYVVGLALGVHLLNLLALPTIFLIIYFQRKEIDWESFLIFAGLSTLAFVGIYPGVVKGIPQIIQTLSFVAVGAFVLVLVVVTNYFIKNRNRNAGLVMMCLLMVVVGYSTYSTIYIRSSLDPVIDENDPDTPAKFVKYLNREQYGDWSIFDRRADVWEYQFKKMYVRYFGWQFIGKGTNKAADGLLADTISFRGLMGLPFLIGLLGMVHHFLRDWRRASSVMTLFIMTGLAIVYYLNQEDPQPRERDYAYTGSFFAFAIWIGIGTSFLLELARDAFRENVGYRKIAAGVLAGVLLFAVPGNMLSFNYADHNRKGNFVAYDYSKNILETCEPNAIIFTNGDNDTFPLWFLQTVYGIRNDVRVINLSLLNTDWYIKQLRDHEPKVPINLTDAQIDGLAPRGWKEQEFNMNIVSQELHDEWVEKIQAIDSTYVNNSKPGLRFNMRPTLITPYGNGIRIQDMMILHILEANRFKRPVYFAVTVAPSNLLGMDEFMRMDGLAFKLMPIKVARRFADPEIIRKNLFEKYSYRNLDNPEVYYNDNIIALLGNYRSSFMTLMSAYMSKGQEEKALEAIDRMNEVVPESVIPPPDMDYSLYIGRLYQQLGRPEEFKKRVDRYAYREDLSPEMQLQFLSIYADWLNDKDAAREYARRLTQQEGTRSEAFEFLISRAALDGDFKQGAEWANEWATLEPQNQAVQSRLEELNKLAASRDSSAVQDSAGLK